MSKVHDLTGQRFGRLVVLEQAENSKDRKKQWRCRCDCGNEVVVRGYYLHSGLTKSCGCFHKERTKQVGKANAQHGLSHTRLYCIWNDMIRRCYNQKATRYSNYGGRGITVCDEWKNDFMAFRDWAVANGYNDNLTIDRKDNNKGYHPENCRWATVSEQANNMRSNTMLTYNGKTQNMKLWSNELGISYSALVSRFKRGWNVDKALSTPVRKINKKEME